MIIEFETAKSAKEVGFIHMKSNCYGDNMCYQLPDGELTNALKGNVVTGYILAPTQSELQTWLREKHNIVAQAVIPNDVVSTGIVNYEIELVVLSENRGSTKNVYGRNMIFPTWEKALEAGLVAGLKLINDEKP